MGLYARYLLPRLTHLAMDRKLLLPYRQRVISGAIGRVLEIGVGSGLNLPLYSDGVEEVIGIDISPQLLAMAERSASLQSQRPHPRVRLLEGSAENLPSTIADGSVDTVVVTWALCSIPNVGRLSPRPIVCSAAVGRFASSSTDGRPMPRWPYGRIASLPCRDAARAAVISIGKRMTFSDRQGSDLLIWRPAMQRGHER
jgi:SAM-dependent methyltransferase